jgi:hypothetical protein
VEFPIVSWILQSYLWSRVWKELDVWEEGGPGERDLWDRAKTTEFLQRSRAFTEEPSYRDDWDEDIYGYAIGFGM